MSVIRSGSINQAFCNKELKESFLKLRNKMLANQGKSFDLLTEQNVKYTGTFLGIPDISGYVDPIIDERFNIEKIVDDKNIETHRYYQFTYNPIKKTIFI